MLLASSFSDKGPNSNKTITAKRCKDLLKQLIVIGRSFLYAFKLSLFTSTIWRKNVAYSALFKLLFFQTAIQIFDVWPWVMEIRWSSVKSICSSRKSYGRPTVLQLLQLQLLLLLLLHGESKNWIISKFRNSSIWKAFHISRCSVIIWSNTEVFSPKINSFWTR